MADVSRSVHRHPVTRQQKNLLLAEPIARLSPERFRGLAIDPALVDSLDLKYLALVAIDFVMERSAVDGGATDAEIVAFLASEAHLMQPGLNQEECRRIGRAIVDQLANARDGHRAFSERYFSREDGRTLVHTFQLLTLAVDVNGTVRFRLHRDAQVLTLGMLDVPPDFAEEAEAIMIRRAIERGRFRDARTLAERARLRSIHYRRAIDDALFDARRAIERMAWSEQTIPMLDAARTHLQERLRHEAEMIGAAGDVIGTVSGEERDHLVDLREILTDCRSRHHDLFVRVMTASEEFRDAQVHAFRARPRRDIPELEDQVLVPLLSCSIGSVAAIANDIVVLFGAPRPRRLFDLARAFELCTRPRDHGDPDEAEGGKFADLVPLAPTFAEDEIAEAGDWLARTVGAAGRIDMHGVLAAGEQDELEPRMLRCVLFLMLRSWSPGEDPLDVVASIDGTIDHRRIAGDNLVLERQPERWTTSTA